MMTDFNTDSNQCDLNINLNNLFYLIGLNIVFIFLPTFALTIIYLNIILKVNRRYHNFIELFKSNKNTSNSHDIDLEDKTENFPQPATSTPDMQLNRVSSLKITIKNSISSRKESMLNFTVNNSLSQMPERISLNSFRKNAQNKLKAVIKFSLVTLVFICCQMPIRVFLCWSYYNTYLSLNDIERDNVNEKRFRLINLISNLTKLVFFLHCISNPIIYYVLSIKFRTAFLKFITTNDNKIFGCKFGFKKSL